MKHQFVTFLALALFAVACKQEKHEVIFGVDLQNSFANDSVEVRLDGAVLLSGLFTTNDLLGVCLPDGIFRTKCMTGTHQIEVRINNTFYKHQKFIVQKDIYYTVRFEPASGNIILAPFEAPFLYD